MEMNETEALEVAEQAAALVLRVASGDPAAEAEVPQFIARSPEHLKQLTYGIALHMDIRELGPKLHAQNVRRATEPGPGLARSDTRVRRPARISIGRRVSISIATAIGLGLMTLFGLYQYYQPLIAFPGHMRSFRLSDGSFIQLNGGSLAHPDIRGNGRSVTLWYGEALFDVEHDLLRPFYVIAGDAVLRAVGTRFDVKLLPAEATVTVTEGRVDVEKHCDSRSGAAASDMPGDDNAITLVAGQSATVSRDGCIHSLQDRGGTEIDRELAWAHQKLKFEAEPLESVVNQFNRYNRMQLSIRDEAIRNVPIRGGFDSKDVDRFVAMLKSRGVKAIAPPGQDDHHGEIILVATDCQWDGVHCTNR